MELLIFLALTGGGMYFKALEQRQRIALLGQHLGQFEIEKLMESLMQGYQRALGEESIERQRQVWAHFASQEEKLSAQFAEFAKAFSGVWADNALVSTLPIALPRADKLFPAATFDVRKAFQIHADGLHAAVRNTPEQCDKDRAYAITAELMLMQHTCHWFCRSKTVASARLLKQHKTRYEQVLAAVSAPTRQRYTALTIHKP